MNDTCARFEFQTVILDPDGTIKERRSGQAEYFVEHLGGAELEMVKVPAGRFIMGSPDDESGRRSSESPQHEVENSAFFIGRFPITQAQWRPVMKTLPVTHDKFQGDRLPVVNVGWEKALEYCERLSDLSGRSYRLPTEAEWEYACRAGTTTAFHFGPTINSDVANFKGANGGSNRQRLTPVDYFDVANHFGLSDLHGNVWEWCMDEWHADYAGAPFDGGPWMSGCDPGYRVQRGGSWRDDALR